MTRKFPPRSKKEWEEYDMFLIRIGYVSPEPPEPPPKGWPDPESPEDD